MVDYDLDAEGAKIAEYEDRTLPVERRPPTRKMERQEPRDWPKRIEEANKDMETIRIGLSNEQVAHLRGVQMSQLQIKYHQNTDI